MLHYDRISISIFKFKVSNFLYLPLSHFYGFTHMCITTRYFLRCIVQLPKHYKVLITSLLLLRLLCFFPSVSAEKNINCCLSKLKRRSAGYNLSSSFQLFHPPNSRIDLENKQHYLSIYCGKQTVAFIPSSLHVFNL